MNQRHPATNSHLDRMSTVYVLGLLSVLGLFAAVSALLIAWPALSYLGAKLV